MTYYVSRRAKNTTSYHPLLFQKQLIYIIFWSYKICCSYFKELPNSQPLGIIVAEVNTFESYIVEVWLNSSMIFQMKEFSSSESKELFIDSERRYNTIGRMLLKILKSGFLLLLGGAGKNSFVNSLLNISEGIG